MSNDNNLLFQMQQLISNIKNNTNQKEQSAIKIINNNTIDEIYLILKAINYKINSSLEKIEEIDLDELKKWFEFGINKVSSYNNVINIWHDEKFNNDKILFYESIEAEEKKISIFEQSNFIFFNYM
jgi:esterase/lipase